MTPNKPSYVLGYWRPWNEDSSMVDSWLNYTKDVSLAKYSADVIGYFIEQASKEQGATTKNELKALIEFSKSII